MADEVTVMYAGAVAESGDVHTVFERPRHPYTWGLLNSRPRWDQERSGPLPSIRGTPPDLSDLSDECPYLPRCPKAVSLCRTSAAPPLAELEAGHHAACYNPMQVVESASGA
jgi:oligopeptide/dipeptide ABC transporter ATP-binding protein